MKTDLSNFPLYCSPFHRIKSRRVWDSSFKDYAEALLGVLIDRFQNFCWFSKSKENFWNSSKNLSSFVWFVPKFWWIQEPISQIWWVLWNPSNPCNGAPGMYYISCFMAWHLRNVVEFLPWLLSKDVFWNPLFLCK